MQRNCMSGCDAGWSECVAAKRFASTMQKRLDFHQEQQCNDEHRHCSASDRWYVIAAFPQLSYLGSYRSQMQGTRAGHFGTECKCQLCMRCTAIYDRILGCHMRRSSTR
mmetsp:Transcript_17084/g.32407  ORF Transcript_17084/g.32407 Transcript_17084/m.32407 type:complete len:109 (+) Transcript_17084:145-471(+)